MVNAENICIYLIIFLLGLLLGSFIKEGRIFKKIVWQQTFPIIVEGEFGDYSSYVEYWICKDNKGKYSFHYKGKFAKSHEGYNLAYLKFISLENSA